MIDLDIRALQVRLLKPHQLGVLHGRELDYGFALGPALIQKLAGLPQLKAAYGVPLKPKAIKAWGQTVREVLGRFRRERGLQGSLEQLDQLHAFDRVVAASDLDFHFETATPAKRVRDDDWFSRSPGDL